MEAAQIYRPADYMSCTCVMCSSVSKQAAYNLISTIVDLAAGEMKMHIIGAINCTDPYIL
jgi:hypothetical protein